jgi:hypothetical protein
MKILIVFLCLFSSLGALQRKPWLSPIWEFELDTSYTFSRYHHFSEAKKQIERPANDQLFYVDLGVAPAADWSVDVDFEVADSPRRPFGFQSVAAQYRKLLLDDVIGDPISLTTGISCREVFSKSVKDVNSPYHSYVNVELNASMGKEWEDPPYWRMRSYLFTALGMANRGAPWVRLYAAWEHNQKDEQQWKLFAEGYVGFGHVHEVNIDHFHGYASIHHRSIDVGIAYRYLFLLWGSLSIEYAHRVYARSFPAHVNFFTVRYRLPFSLF